MACGFCIATPVNPCPVCAGNLTTTPRPMRRAKASTDRRKVVNLVAGRGVQNHGVVVGSIRSAPAQAPRVAILSVCCNDCEDVFPAGRAIPSGMVKLDSGILVCEGCAERRQRRIGAVVDWTALGDLARTHMARKATAPQRVLGAHAGAVVPTEATTLPPIARFDWSGLARAVEAGHLSEAQAIELAASWRGGAEVRA